MENWIEYIKKKNNDSFKACQPSRPRDFPRRVSVLLPPSTVVDSNVKTKTKKTID